MQKIEEKSSSSVALVLAAGTGERLGLGPKAFLRLGGQTLLARVADVLSSCVGRVIVGAPAGFVAAAHKEVGNRAEAFSGGLSRRETLLQLLSRCNEELILIHDVARPLVRRELVMRVLAAAEETGAATAIAEQSVHVVATENGYLGQVIPRFKGGIGGTPSAYCRSAINQALRYAAEHCIEDLVPYALLVSQGTLVRAVPSDQWNIKITTPLDWEVAKLLSSSLTPGSLDCPVP